jgi:hypothetical protein
VRPAIQTRIDRGALKEAVDLAQRAVEAYPQSLHLNELALESRVALRGERQAWQDFGAFIAEREATGPAFESRLVLAISRLRRGDAAAAQRVLAPEPPPVGHPQLNAWLHNRVDAEAALGDLEAVKRSMALWREKGGAPAELRARYAVSLSMAGLRDPELDFVPLLRDALEGQAEIEDRLIVAWLYQRLIAHWMAAGELEAALAAFDEGSAEVELEGITRAEIARGLALAKDASQPGAVTAGELAFAVPISGARGSLLVSPDVSEPPDADYEVVALDGRGRAVVRRSESHWPVRWVYRDTQGRPLASGAAWPSPGASVDVPIRLSRAPQPPRYELPPRRSGDGRRRIFTLVLDCGDWRLIQYLRARDEIPALDALLTEGRRAVLHSDPPLTAAAMESLVWPARSPGMSVIGWMHRMGLELGGLEDVGFNPLGFLEALLPGSESLFDVIGSGDRVAANMLFSHGVIDAGHHAQLVGPKRRRRELAVAHVLRPMTPAERVTMLGVLSSPRHKRQAERIAGEFDAAMELAASGEVDLLMLRIEALDLLTHSLYSQLIEAGQDDGQADLLDVYRYIDRRLAELAGALDADDILVVMSDHGIRTAMEHAEDAVFVAQGAGVQPGRAVGQPDLRGVPRVLADWLGVETVWPDSGIGAGVGDRHAGL